MGVAWLFAVALSVGLLLHLLEAGSESLATPRFVPVFVGTIPATWALGGTGFAAAIAVSGAVTVAATVEILARRLLPWRTAIPCMFAVVIAELLTVVGLHFAAGC
jgi:hypothetical protein